MFCPKCGKEIDDKAVVCIGCGIPVTPKEVLAASFNNKTDAVSTNKNQTAVDAPSVNGTAKKGFPIQLSWIFALCSIACVGVALVIGIIGVGFMPTQDVIFMKMYFDDTTYFSVLFLNIAAAVFGAGATTFAILERKLYTKGFQFSTLIISALAIIAIIPFY